MSIAVGPLIKTIKLGPLATNLGLSLLAFNLIAQGPSLKTLIYAFLSLDAHDTNFQKPENAVSGLLSYI